jgi:hypothetical protein
MHLRTKLRRLRNLNFCRFASTRQLSCFSAMSLLTAAISPGDFFDAGDGDSAFATDTPTEITANAERTMMRSI